MSDNNLELQISEVNRKLDLMLEEATVQRQNRETITDIVDDLTIVGNDAFKGMVEGLDNAGIELDFDSINHLFLGFIRNIENINMLLMTLENVTDLMKDAGPIIKQIGIDSVDKFNEIDQKGYFEVIKQIGVALDNIMARYSREDISNLSENITLTADTLINLFDPAVIKKANNAITALKNAEPEEVEKYSLWKMMKDMRSPEMKKGLGYMMTFMKEFMR